MTKKPSKQASGKRWNVRELARQITASAFEHAVLGPPRLSTALRETHPAAAGDVKDVDSLEFVDLVDGHSETDLHSALLCNLQVQVASVHERGRIAHFQQAAGDHRDRATPACGAKMADGTRRVTDRSARGTTEALP